MLQVPFFICRYLLLNIQVPFSTRQQAIHGTVLFTPDLLTPRTAFPSLPATLPVFWNVSTHLFSTHVHTQSLPRPRDATSIDENWTLTERRVRHLERTVLGRYLLSCHTVTIVVAVTLVAKQREKAHWNAGMCQYQHSHWALIRFRKPSALCKSFSLGANARGCRPTPSSRWRRTLASPRLITGKFTDTAHLLETHTSWGYCHWYEEHWGGVSSRDRQSLRGDEVDAHFSFPGVEGDCFRSRGWRHGGRGWRMLNWSDRDWHITLSFLLFMSFAPCSILPDLKHNKPNQLLGNVEIKDAIWWNNNKFWHWAWYLTDNERGGGTSLRSTTDIGISDCR